MDKIIFFENENQKKDRCVEQVYRNFLDYAFEKTNYFMLVYVNYFGNGYTKQMKWFRESLDNYKIKSRTNPSWPGTLETKSPNTTYKIVFYNNCLEAKNILKKAKKMSEWSRPSNPQDLAFFKGNQCWFYSVGHEKIAAILHANQEDMDFLKSNGLVDCKTAFIPYNNYYDAFDEEIE